MRMPKVASSPSTTSASLPRRTSVRLDFDSSILRERKVTGCMKPLLPAGCTPARAS